MDEPAAGAPGVPGVPLRLGSPRMTRPAAGVAGMEDCEDGESSSDPSSPSSLRICFSAWRFIVVELALLWLAYRKLMRTRDVLRERWEQSRWLATSRRSVKPATRPHGRRLVSNLPTAPDGIGCQTSLSRIADLFVRVQICVVSVAESNTSYSPKPFQSIRSIAAALVLGSENSNLLTREPGRKFTRGSAGQTSGPVAERSPRRRASGAQTRRERLILTFLLSPPVPQRQRQDEQDPGVQRA